MKVMHLPSSLKIKILYKSEDIAFLYTLMQWNDIDVFHKYMYTCCVDVNPKICLTNNVSVKTWCLNVNNLHVHDFTWHENHLFTLTCTTLIGTQAIKKGC